jgi:hypothetical protein
VLIICQSHLLYVEQMHRDNQLKCRRSYHNQRKLTQALMYETLINSWCLIDKGCMPANNAWVYSNISTKILHLFGSMKIIYSFTTSYLQQSNVFLTNTLKKWICITSILLRIQRMTPYDQRLKFPERTCWKVS